MLHDLVDKLSVNDDSHSYNSRFRNAHNIPTARIPRTPSNNWITKHASARPSLQSLETISASLLDAFPSPEDTELLITASRGVLIHCHNLNADRRRLLTPEDYTRQPHTILPSVDPRIHPVILARHMLHWVLFLQSPWYHRDCKFSEPPRIIMERLVEAAISLVTTNDEVHGSLESLECIMMEALYHSHFGNLRRAWIVNRRAMLLAQMMGVHRFPNQALKSIDPDASFHPPSMWFRLVYVDRYLCLFLGLPQGTSDKCAMPQSLLKDQPAVFRLERALCAIATRILERNESGVCDHIQDQAIDNELLKVYQSFPEAFWRVSNFDTIVQGSFEDIAGVDGLVAQVFHFHLLNQLHLPYMLSFIRGNRSSDVDRHIDYSTISCANASREILKRFVAYRGFNYVALCFRPADFAAFTAGLSLLLAHFDSHLSRRQGRAPSVAGSILAHQRSSDRTMLEDVLDKLDLVGQYNDDEMCLEGAKLLRSLLDIEDDAAQGKQYEWASSGTKADAGIVGMHSEQIENGPTLRISIPYFGSICISRTGRISKEFPPDAARFGQSGVRETGGVSSAGISSDPGAYVDMSTLTDGIPMGQQFTNSYSSNNESISNEEHVMTDWGPAITAGMDDWAFQGVDMAFFDNLLLDASAAPNLNI